MVALAPHLVRPLPLVVPAFDGARPDRLMGVGLNLYDVMSVDRGRLRPRRGRAERAGARGGEAEEAAEHGVEPRAPPHDLRRGGAGAAARARPARADRRLPLLRLPDRRRAPGADRARRGRALRGGVRQPRGGRRPARSDDGRAQGVRALDLEGARSSWCAPPTSSTPPASGPTSCARRSSTTRPSCRAHQAEPRHPPHAQPRGPAAGRRGDRARRRGPLDLRAALAGAHAGGHDRQRLRGRPRPRAALRGGRRLPAGRRQHVLRHRAGARAT